MKLAVLLLLALSALAVADGPHAHVKKCKPRARLSDSQLWTFVPDGRLVSNGSAVSGGTPVALSTSAQVGGASGDRSFTLVQELVQ